MVCRHVQRTGWVIVQAVDPPYQNFISRTGWNGQRLWTINTQSFSTLQLCQSFSREWKCLSLQFCLKKLIQFLLLKSNLHSIKRHHVANFHSQVRLFSPGRWTWKQRRHVLVCEKMLATNETYCSLAFCLEMEQFVSALVSVYNNNNLNTLSTSEQELQKNQAEQNPTYQIDSLKKGKWKKVACQSRHFSRQNFVWSTYPVKIAALIIRRKKKWSAVVGLCFHNCGKKTLVFPTFSLDDLTALEYLQLWFWIRIPKPKREQCKKKNFTQNLNRQHKNSIEWRLLLGLKSSFDVWILLLLIDLQEKRLV